MDSPEDWRWLWLISAAVFAIGEMVTPGSFFLAPFAVGAFVASMLAFGGVSVPIEWAVFLGVSIATLLALRPVARRLDRDALDHGVGSRRLLGRTATVLREVPAGDDLGMVRVDREEWRAQSIDGQAIPAGATVRVADVQGTRVIVAPVDLGSGPPPIDGSGVETPPFGTPPIGTAPPGPPAAPGIPTREPPPPPSGGAADPPP
jgi:membrane protein implicated in regulation of membrane protease activity